MCCVDIWLSECFTLAVNCKLRTYLNTVATFPTLWTLTVCILLDSGMLMRYLVIFFSAAERYLALCKPFVHQSNILVRHIRKSLAGLTALITTLVTCFTIAQLSTIYKWRSNTVYTSSTRTCYHRKNFIRCHCDCIHHDYFSFYYFAAQFFVERDSTPS